MKVRLSYVLFVVLMIIGAYAFIALLKKNGVADPFDTMGDLCGVLVGFMVFRVHAHIRSFKWIVLISVFATFASLLVRSAYSILSITLPAHPAWNIDPMPAFVSLPMLAAGKGGVFILLVKEFVSDPLLEELMRKPMQKGLTLVMNEWVSLLLVALLYSAMHVGYAAQEFPFFVIVGLMVKVGFTWFERALMHATSNFFIVANVMTFNVGAYQKSGEIQIVKLCLEMLALALILIFMWKPLRAFYLTMNAQEQDNGGPEVMAPVWELRWSTKGVTLK